MYAALVVADDLTGATDTGQQFAVDGYRMTVTSRSNADGVVPAPERETDALVVDTDSRTVDETEAYGAVADVVDDFPAEIVYKKVDSTLRGNVTSEVEAVLDRRRPDVAVVAPAFPAADRVTAGGHHLVDGQPVSSAADYQDREAPPSTSHVPTLLSELSYPVEHVPIDTIAEGADATAEALAAAKANDAPTVAVCDATSGGHLAAIARAADRVGASVFVGSAGLAEHVELSGDASARNRVLGVVGSTNERSIEQLARLPDEWVVELDLERALDEPETAGREAADRANAVIESRGVAVVASAGSSDEVARTLRVGRERFDLDDETVRKRVEAALTSAVEECWVESAPEGLFVTGGTVAKHVLGALDVDTVELTGRDIEDGIPVARFGDERADATRLVTKAGGFGGPETIANCLTALRRP